MSDTCHHCGKNEATLELRVDNSGDPYEVCDHCWEQIRLGRELPHVAQIPCHLPVPIPQPRYRTVVGEPQNDIIVVKKRYGPRPGDK